MRSFVVKPELGTPSPERIVATAHFMARRGIYGVVWLDAELRAVERLGDMVGSIPLGEAITDSISAFLGFEDEIRLLQVEPNRSVAIPNVLMEEAAQNAHRVNLAVYWIVEQQVYLLLVARAVSRADLEYALTAEVRARAIVEAELAAQAKLVQRVNEELGIANRDLEEFAYVISHDLRAPLRGVRYAATDAQAALVAGETEAALEDLERVVLQSRRMSTMLTGLLEYARIGRKTDGTAELDLGTLAAEIAASCGEETGFEVTVEGVWPVIVTVAEAFDIVLRNLVDNAIKHHDRGDGRVVIRADDSDNFIVVSVIDDGPGIAPEWHQAIFQPFKQVADGERAPDGSGIGLALVKKTVERFGGRIEVISAPAVSRGTTFRVVWPKTIAS